MTLFGFQWTSSSLESVFLTQRVHPFPFRTRKLSFAVPKILGWRRPGKIGHSRHKGYFKYPFKYSSLAQSVERMTVNHDVAGSSPAGGAKRKRVTKRLLSFVFLSFVRLAPARRHDCATCCAERRLLFCKTKSKLAVERSETVSHGSSPAGGAKKTQGVITLCFLFTEI